MIVPDVQNNISQSSEGIRQAQKEEALRRAAGKTGQADGAEKKQRQPQYDKYIHEDEEDKRKAGVYRVAYDENGKAKIQFDDPDRVSEKEEGKLPDKVKGTSEEEEEDKESKTKKAKGKKVESCRGNTDKVDQEIEKLKKKRDQLKQRIHTEKDEVKAEELKKQLAQVESELKRKDNDAYRRRHTVFS